MKFLVLFASFVSLAHSGAVLHNSGEDGHGRATSYQRIHFEHYHPVPTFIKKEHQGLVDKPISAGKSSTSIEVHHGDKHDQGYAIVDNQKDDFGSTFDEGVFGEAHLSSGSQEHDQGSSFGSHEQLGQEGGEGSDGVSYEAQDHGGEYGQQAGGSYEAQDHGDEYGQQAGDENQGNAHYGAGEGGSYEVQDHGGEYGQGSDENQVNAHYEAGGNFDSSAGQYHFGEGESQSSEGQQDDGTSTGGHYHY